MGKLELIIAYFSFSLYYIFVNKEMFIFLYIRGDEKASVWGAAAAYM